MFKAAELLHPSWITALPGDAVLYRKTKNTAKVGLWGLLKQSDTDSLLYPADLEN